jgi:hypothetical protein
MLLLEKDRKTEKTGGKPKSNHTYTGLLQMNQLWHLHTKTKEILFKI